MSDQIKPEYRAMCAQLAPKLAELHDLFEEIAAGKHDRVDYELEGCVDLELQKIQSQLRDALGLPHHPARPL